jgi:predicted esterase
VTQESKVHTLQTATTGRYLVRTSTNPGPAPVLVGFHGYGENAQHHLDELIQFPETDGWLVVSFQALHRFYERKSGTVVASWMTSQDREPMIADNLRYVDAVLESVQSSQDTTSVVVYSGFSQGVAMAYRAATRGRIRPAGIIALGGDVPPELRDDDTLSWPHVLVGRGSEDTFYTHTKMEDDLAFLRATNGTIESVVFEGGHHFHDDFRGAAGRLLSSVREKH